MDSGFKKSEDCASAIEIIRSNLFDFIIDSYHQKILCFKNQNTIAAFSSNYFNLFGKRKCSIEQQLNWAAGALFNYLDLSEADSQNLNSFGFIHLYAITFTIAVAC